MAQRLTIADLYDPAKFRTEKRVVSFEPHKRTVKPQNASQPVTLDVQAKDIHAILNEAKKLEAKGYFPRITDGHINQDPNYPERDQPPLLGFMSNPELVVENGQPCVAYDYHLRLPYANILSERPNRSAEFAYTKNQIRGMALLLRDPALDMGTMHQFANHGDPIVYYGVSEMDPTLDPENKKPDEGKTTPGEDAIVKKVMEAMLMAFPGLASLASAPKDPNAPPTDPNAPPVVPASMATPSATTCLPGEKNMKYSGDALAFYHQTQVLAAKIQTLEQDRINDQKIADASLCVETINNLVIAKYDIDAPYELGVVKMLPPAARPAYIANIKRRSKRLPGSADIPILQGNIDYSALDFDRKEKTGTMSQEDSRKITDYMQRHRCDFDVAKEKLKL